MNTIEKLPPVDPYALLSTLRLDALRDLRHDPQLGPLVTGDGEIDGYTLARMLPAVPGWQVMLEGEDVAIVGSRGDHAAIVVMPPRPLITVGMTEDAALTLLRGIQSAFLAVQLEMDEQQEPYLV